MYRIEEYQISPDTIWFKVEEKSPLPFSKWTTVASFISSFEEAVTIIQDKIKYPVTNSRWLFDDNGREIH